jgi:hypothetical protein
MPPAVEDTYEHFLRAPGHVWSKARFRRNVAAADARVQNPDAIPSGRDECRVGLLIWPADDHS